MDDTRLLFLDGAWVAASGNRSAAVVNPASGDIIANVGLAERPDLERAVDAAKRAFADWRFSSPVERGRLLRRAAELLRQRVELIAPSMTMEQGKTLAEARGEVSISAECLEWFAEEARRGYGRVVPSRSRDVSQLVLKEPIGPAAGFVPWNFSMGQAARKVGAALAAGCTMVLKAPEETPAACTHLVQALNDAGLPAGVVNLVFGVPSEISDYLIPHPDIRKISFTGSTAVGKHLAAMAGRHMKPITMELGGHSPVIVTKDVDVVAVARLVGTVKFRNAGQNCTSPTRFIIAREIYRDFLSAFTDLARGLVVGNGLEEGVQMGPLANSRRLDMLDALVEDAVQKGGVAHLSGGRSGNRGFFYRPTILTDVPTDARIMSEEPFGPIAIMSSFATLDDALAQANRVDYGLASYAFTRSLADAAAIETGFASGLVSINGFGLNWPELPFGGVRDSGYGSAGGLEAVDAFLTTKTVARFSA